MKILTLRIMAGALLLGQVAIGQTKAGAGEEELRHAQGTNMGIFTFTGRCGTCHDTGKSGALDRYHLNRFSPEDILKSMTTGTMAQYAEGLTDLQKSVISVYVGGRPLGSLKEGDASNMKGHCSTVPSLSKAADAEAWNGWGFDPTNSRFQPNPGISADQVSGLKLKWAFGFPEGNSAYGQPTVAGGKVFVGSDTGFVYSLAADSGCVYWSFKANAGVRTAIVLGTSKGTQAKQLIYFGDIKGNLYAIHAQTGALAWTLRADTHPFARITGTPVLENGLLYVAISSLEESGGGNPNYACCTFRGAVAVYNASSGKLIWKSYTITDEAQPTKKTSIGTQLWAPAGAGLWSSPTLDLKRHAIYVATGNGYTEPAADTTDAIMAFDMRSGKRLWVNQVRANDAYVRDCPGKYRPNVPTTNRSETCPDHLGPDVDFGNAPMLRTLPDGRSLIVVGQKDGNAWALDPDKQGAVVWTRLVGLGIDSGGGGMQWGSAADNDMAYFPLTRGGKGSGLAALKLDSGELAWRASPPMGSSAPATVIPGVVFSGSNMGMMYAYSTKDGHSLWEFDTNRAFTTVNGVEAKGGGFGGAAGPVVANGMVFVPSGYSDLFGGPLRGNVLLAFGVK
ncbi:MAG: cytochrome oxidase Cbb3 [Acidobacteriaceae bacterium]|nr:cytochrome oxidase Cbb3 [Acidobacteriaceae bacterium]